MYNCSLNNQSSTVCKFTPIIIPYRYIRIVSSWPFTPTRRICVLVTTLVTVRFPRANRNRGGYIDAYSTLGCTQPKIRMRWLKAGMTSPDYKKRMRQSSERLRKNPAARYKRGLLVQKDSLKRTMEFITRKKVKL